MTRADAATCKNGHPRTPENTGRRRDPRWPVCLACKREADARMRAGGGDRWRTEKLLPCGTTAAYHRHKHHGETPCAKCVAAFREATRVHTIGIDVEIEGKIARGWPAARIRDVLGVTQAQVAAAWRRIDRAHNAQAS